MQNETPKPAAWPSGPELAKMTQAEFDAYLETVRRAAAKKFPPRPARRTRPRGVWGPR